MKIIVSLILLVTAPFLSMCQTFEKTADQAYIVTRMVNKFHVEPRELNTAFSIDVFNAMLNGADDDKVFFTQGDINKLAGYRTTLGIEIKLRKTGYLNLFTRIYLQRLKQADSLIDQIGKKPLNFYIAEKLTAAEDTAFPASAIAMRAKFYKKVKAGVLDELSDDLPGDIKSYTPARQKIYIDSSLVAMQKKVTTALKRRIEHIIQDQGGIAQYVGDIYCKTIASCFDPHTEFFPPREKEEFEVALGKQPFQFGFSIKPDKNGGILIDNLQAGTPAYRCGKLNKGDKFIGLQWDNRKMVDVSDVGVHEFNALLDEAALKQVSFTVKKADGSTVLATLQREQATGDDDTKVKSFVLKGENTIGYIYLPAFYQDWESSNEGLNGCANDVGREIIKLKKENINGLIIDVRYNGGGSVTEATELAGIFIDAGPVAQEKERDAKVNTLKDINRGTVFDGPLVVMVNGQSASASELLAGTLQDYHRAVIVGSPTYGKATMQVVLPMDTTVTRETITQKHTENYLKVTVAKLYRVNGTTAQFKGVEPDILIPDILDAYITKEADEPNALKPTTIAANKYYMPNTPLPLKTSLQGIQNSVDTAKYFNAVKAFVASARQKRGFNDISLQVNDVIAEMNTGAKDAEPLKAQSNTSKKFTVLNTIDEAARLKADKNLGDQNEEFAHQVASDAGIGVAYDVLLKLKPM